MDQRHDWDTVKGVEEDGGGGVRWAFVRGKVVDGEGEGGGPVGVHGVDLHFCFGVVVSKSNWFHGAALGVAGM